MGVWIEKQRPEILDSIVGNDVVIGDEEPGRHNESGTMPDAACDDRRRSKSVADGVA